MPTLEEFNEYVRKLAAHDWYYEFSNDQSAWMLGHRLHRELLKTAQSDPIYEKAFKAFNASYYSPKLLSSKNKLMEKMAQLQKLLE